PQLNLDLFEEVWHFSGPAELFGDALAHGVARQRFTMGYVDFFRFEVALLQPGQDFVVVAVGRHGSQVVDLGFHWPVFALDFYRFCAVYQRITPGARRLKASKYDAVAWIGQQRFQMVQHSTTRGHATGGYDDAGKAHGVQLYGFFYRTNEFGFIVDQLALTAIQLVLFVVFTENFGGLDGHRAVQVNRQFWNAPLSHQFMHHVQKHLRPTNGKGRHEGYAAAARGFGDDVLKIAFRV